MQCLEVSGAVRLIYRSLGVKGLKTGVNLQGMLKKKGVKQGLGVYRAHLHYKVHITREETLLTC